MLSDEIGLDVDAVETDLGEWIIQLLGDRPSHILAPAVHLSAERVAELFSERSGERLDAADTRRLVGYARRALRDPAAAEEALQETFVRAWRSADRYDRERPLRPWLFRTIRNRCIDTIRQRRTVSLTATEEADEGETAALADRLADADPLPEELVERADLQQLLAAAIARLPARYREVVALRYTTDLTFGEVAEALGIPENTAKIHFHRAKALLRETLRGLL
jgi:RNA polymerase sigma-70 factor (ECF subfamily)